MQWQTIEKDDVGQSLVAQLNAEFLLRVTVSREHEIYCGALELIAPAVREELIKQGVSDVDHELRAYELHPMVLQLFAPEPTYSDDEIKDAATDAKVAEQLKTSIAVAAQEYFTKLTVLTKEML
jgi:hypothetical protein